MSRIAMIALAAIASFAFVTSADAYSRRSSGNSKCAAIGAMYAAVVDAKQEGTSRAAIDSIADKIGDATAAAKMKEVIAHVFEGTDFDMMDPKDAKQIFQASCTIGTAAKGSALADLAKQMK